MIYALNLAEDKRILSACVVLGWREGDDIPETYNEMPVVETLPEGNLPDYRYTNGEYVHDPLPIPDDPDPQPTQEERIAQLEEELKAAKILLGLEV